MDISQVERVLILLVDARQTRPCKEFDRITQLPSIELLLVFLRGHLISFFKVR
jgi:hypothetical protein